MHGDIRWQLPGGRGGAVLLTGSSGVPLCPDALDGEVGGYSLGDVDLRQKETTRSVGGLKPMRYTRHLGRTLALTHPPCGDRSCSGPQRYQ